MTEGRHRRRYWTWQEIEFVTDRPDWTCRELSREMREAGIGDRTPTAVQRMRDRYGRWSPNRPPLCWKCGQHHVMAGNALAERWGLCRECYEQEQRLREQDRKRNDALRQMRLRNRRGKGPRDS